MDSLPKSRLLRFVERAVVLARRAVSRVSTRYSRKRFTLRQHVVLLCLKVKKAEVDTPLRPDPGGGFSGRRHLFHNWRVITLRSVLSRFRVSPQPWDRRNTVHRKGTVLTTEPVARRWTLLPLPSRWRRRGAGNELPVANRCR